MFHGSNTWKQQYSISLICFCCKVWVVVCGMLDLQMICLSAQTVLCRVAVGKTCLFAQGVPVQAQVQQVAVG